ncbi:hypothetical protein [Pseudomonas eucalypticola]|uniref:Dermonecrotic toxin N-terminal domain-containing protein n=1 Tax=Pseudomonas eucalypticola TaxID=2599595 RepID=A0A7D5DAD3_9PSED|nr:hypothetical protein [Pseudomonas eucalypticola]QKZ06697.1 hypothetical protein HWQ56_24140 [Pseudomonas eucalypticola]
MFDLYSLSGQVTRLAPLAGSVSRQFCSRPRLLDVARDVLAQQLATCYPTLSFDLTRLCLITPGRQGAAGYTHRLLTDVLMQRYLDSDNLALVPGYHFFSHQPDAQHPPAVAVKVPQVQGILNEWGPQLLQAYAQALCDYWDEVQPQGGNRWKWLAVWLQTRLKRCVDRQVRDASLDHDEAATATLLVSMPDAQHRGQYQGDALRASLISLQAPVAVEGHAQAAQMTHALIIQRHLSREGRDVVLLYTPVKGVQVFASLDALTQAFAHELAAQVADRPLRMALYEPVENVFEVQAQAILEQQLAAVQVVGAHCRSEPGDAAELQRQVERVTCLFELDSAEEVAQLQAVQAALPAWLVGAAEADRRIFSIYLAELGMLRDQRHGAGMLDGIPGIVPFARQAVQQIIAKHHPEAPATLQDDIEVHLLTTPDALMSIVDGGHRTLTDQQISLAELALDNLSGRPRGHLIIQARKGASLPAWVDTAAIEALVTEADVGTAYIRLLSEKLKDNRHEAAGRQADFAAQLARQLPMVALENKVRQLQGFTADGYRYVAELMANPDAPSVDGRAISLQRLGFKAAPDYHPDFVHSMYLIVALDGQGPCVLYRPLFAEPLMQFDSMDALLQAIVEPGLLQRSVLDWLEPGTVSRYASGGFLEPHIVRFGQGSEFAPVLKPAPATLACQPVSSPLLAYLYEQNVEALITVARRQSMSSSDSRWVSYKALGWTLFNALLPVFSGPLATAGWLVQAMASLDIALQANSRGDDDATSDVITDLFFNVALVLLAHGVPRMPWIKAFNPRPGATPALGVGEVLQAPALQAEGVGTQLSFSWSRAAQQLTSEDRARLASYQVRPPSAALQPVPHGALQGLYEDGGRWLAKLDGHFFQISLEGEQPRIIDPAHPDLPGPWLERDEINRWRLDLSLRLRGGSPNRSIAQKRRENQARREACGVVIDSYNQNRTEMNVKVNVLIRKIGMAQSRGDEALVGSLRERLSDDITPYLQALRDTLAAISELNVLEPAADRSRQQAELLGVAWQLGNEELFNLRMKSHVINREAYPLQATLQEDGLDAGQARLLFDFVQRSTALLDRQIALSKEVQGWRAQLERLPLEGDRVLKTLKGNEVSQVPLQCWMGMLIDGLGLLAIRHITSQGALCDRFANAVVESVRVAAQSHGTLQQSAEYTLNDRVEVLNSVDQQLTAAQEALAYYRELEGVTWDETAMARLDQLIAELRHLAQGDLVPLVREQLKMTRKQRAQARHASIIVTARRGVVVGRRRPVPAAGQPETFEVVDSVEQKVLASFQQDTLAGTWSEVPVPAPAMAKSLNVIAKKGHALFTAADKEVVDAWRQVGKGYIPAEVEEQLLICARQLNEQADAIDRFLTHSNETDHSLPGHESAEARAKAWREKAAQLVREGRLVRIDMTKRQAPTLPRVAYLLGEKAIRIRRTGERKALKKGRDFLQEYEIADLDGTALWYAHFHYSQARSLPSTYERAHLKTAAQRRDGVNRQMAQEAAGEEVIAILRSRIEGPLDHIFLDLET